MSKRKFTNNIEERARFWLDLRREISLQATKMLTEASNGKRRSQIEQQLLNASKHSEDSEVEEVHAEGGDSDDEWEDVPQALKAGGSPKTKNVAGGTTLPVRVTPQKPRNTRSKAAK